MREASQEYEEYNDGKFWFHQKGDLVTVGVTSSAIEEVGDVESIEFPEDGESFKKGETVLGLEGSLGKLDIFAPSNGTIHELNKELQESPEAIVDDLLEGGWLFRYESA
jgi:glycine cleavage system H protein